LIKYAPIATFLIPERALAGFGWTFGRVTDKELRCFGSSRHFGSWRLIKSKIKNF